MPAIDRLTDKAIRAARPQEKPYKLADGAGMFLLVQPHGVKLWRLKFRHEGREKLLSFGPYPTVTLSAAREKRRDARALIVDGIDPLQQKRIERDAKADGARDAFSSVAADYLAKRSAKWSANHRRDVERIINVELVPPLGKRSMRAIRVADIRKIIESIAARGAFTFCHDVRLYFRAIVKHYNSSRENPIPDPSALIDIPDAPVVQHHAALPASDAGEFLRELQHSDALPMTRIATRLLLMTALRTTELRFGCWSEIDTKEKLWRVDSSRMKARVTHIVPLAPRTLALLATLRTMTGEGDLLFPNAIDPARPISEMTILSAIYRLGYKGRLTGHGMRSMFSTWANEHGFNPDAIERQLAHGPANKVRAAYNAAQYLDERRRLMEAWASFLDEAEHDVRVVQIHAASAA